MRRVYLCATLLSFGLCGLSLTSCDDDDEEKLPEVTAPGTEDTGLNKHEAVDLGLSVKWATCNVGANSPEEYGGYYAWGETEEKSNYDMYTYKYFNESDCLTKYCTDSYRGTVDNKTVLESGDDVAHVKWGGSWRMPTSKEIDELINKCSWIWTTQDGVNGYVVTSKSNGNSIFLPAAGSRWDENVRNSGSNGYYRSASLYENHSVYTYYLDFDDSGYWNRDWGYRYDGFSVRPVTE